MSGFSIRNPYFIVVICLALMVIGVASLARMPVDLFPTINLPEVVVATFYSGMPPQDIETDITDPLERFFTLASGIDHMESRSLLGVSIIKLYFQPGTSADADVTQISNLALADLKRLPPGTLPPVVLKFDASSLPVCLVTLKCEGLNETQLHDIGQFTIRNQIAVVKGAEIPPPFGGKYRQIMVYVDPYKLASRQLSPMDVEAWVRWDEYTRARDEMLLATDTPHAPCVYRPLRRQKKGASQLHRASVVARPLPGPQACRVSAPAASGR